MKQLTINPNNRQYYSEDFIKGFECGTQRQLEADMKDSSQGEWIEVNDGVISCKCSVCGWKSRLYEDDVYGMPYCPNCGARMKGADDEDN